VISLGMVGFGNYALIAATIGCTACGRLRFDPQETGDGNVLDANVADASVDAGNSVVDLNQPLSLTCDESVIVARNIPLPPSGGVEVSPTDRGFVIASKSGGTVGDTPTVDLFAISIDVSTESITPTAYVRTAWDQTRPRVAVVWVPSALVVAIGKSMRTFDPNTLGFLAENAIDNNAESGIRSGANAVLTGLADDQRNVVTASFDPVTRTFTPMAVDTASSNVRRVEHVTATNTYWETAGNCLSNENHLQTQTSAASTICGQMVLWNSFLVSIHRTRIVTPPNLMTTQVSWSKTGTPSTSGTVGTLSGTDIVTAMESDGFTIWLSYLEGEGNNAKHAIVPIDPSTMSTTAPVTRLVDPGLIGTRAMLAHPNNGAITVNYHPPSKGLLVTRTCLFSL
jgi:hypothetical protein